MYSAPDFVKVSVQRTNAFASEPCREEWSMTDNSLEPGCKQILMYEGFEYQCYVYIDGPD